MLTHPTNPNHPTTLHPFHNWKHVGKALDDLERLVTCRSALVDHGKGFPFVARNSEDLLVLHDQADHPVENLVLRLVRNAVRDHIEECGDGGTTLVRLVAALVQYWEAEVVAHGVIKARKDFLRFQAEGLQDLGQPGSSCAFQESYAQVYVRRELEGLPSHLIQLVNQFLEGSSEYSRLNVEDGGLALEPALEASRGYRIKAKLPMELNRDPWKTVGTCLVAVVDDVLGSPDSLRYAFGVAAELEQPCVVFCRRLGPLVTPTLVGNHRENGAVWMAYPTGQDQLQDIAALSGAQLQIEWAGLRLEALGSLSGVVHNLGYVVLEQGNPPPSLEKYTLGLKESPDLADRFALLTGDHYTLFLGNSDPAPVKADWRNRIQRVLSAVKHFRDGVGLDYATQIRQWFTWDQIPEHRRGIFFRRLPNRAVFPFPASITCRVWDRACVTASQLLFSDIALLPE